MPLSVPPYEMMPTETDKDEDPRSTRSTMMLIEEEQPPPRDHLAWSLCSTLYGNVLCLGLLAFIFSVKSRDRKVLGDRSGALSYGSTAKYLNITALVINIIITIIVIIVVAVALTSAVQQYHEPSSFHYG